MQSKTGPQLPYTASNLKDVGGTTEGRAQSSSGSNYGPEPGENGQDSLVLARGSCI